MYSFDLETFTRNHLDGDVRNLATLSLGEMQVLPQQYDFALRDNLDNDETNLAWEVYHRVWGLERMPETPPLSPEEPQPTFRGDTINSFRTLFGREITLPSTGGDEIIGFQGLRRFDAEDELFEKVRDFWYTYTCIGNFIPFPNVKDCGVTINTYRPVWHDYFDAFLENLHQCLVGSTNPAPDAKASLPKLINRNSFFWNEYRGPDGWKAFITKFMLEDYCDADLLPKRLYSRLWHWKRTLSRADYIAACHQYIDTATPLILSRGKRMMSAVNASMLTT